MAEFNTSTSGVPWPTIFGIITALGAIAHFIPPLTSSRPVVPQGQRSTVTGFQDVDARLWQDPLQAIDDLDRGSKAGEDDRSKMREFGSLLSQVPDRSVPPKVLAVMLPGLPYAEAAESRLRTRLAVVSALCRARYVPDDGEHLGFTKVAWPRTLLKEPDLPFELTPTRLVPSPGWLSMTRPTPIEDPPLTLAIPYEWWREQRWRDSKAGDLSTSQRILVLWLREDAFEDKPLRRLASIFQPLLPKLKRTSRPQSDITLIGPTQSTTLRTMLVEADERIPSEFDALKAVRVLSPTATTTDELLKLGLGDKRRGPEYSVPAILIHRGHLKSFHRMIATDDILANSLLRELSLRQIGSRSSDTKPCHIAIITEWDTLYGRTLPITFAAEAAGGGDIATMLVERKVDWPPWIHRFSYLRGIDGKLPAKQQDEQSNGRATPPTRLPRTSESPAISPALISPAPAEEIEGRDQSDGLRRLSGELFKLDYQCREDGGIRAVGVLGSDVYDKLLVLKALRKGLPNAIFFTTDLDATYSLPAELPETRNLIVASSFGLQLTHERSAFVQGLTNPLQGLQGDIPPFRDTYQTSIFFTTLYALDQFQVHDQDLDASLRATRLYEIGLDGPVDLSQAQPGEANIHPPWDSFEKVTGSEAICVVLACLIPYGFLCLHLRLSFWPWKWRRFPRSRFFLASLVSAVVICFIIVYLGSGRDGEPLRLFEGVSIWTTEAIRILALGCAVAFLFYGVARLDQNARAISAEYDLALYPPIVPPLRYGQFWRAWKEVIKWNFSVGNPVDSTDLWAAYCLHANRSRWLIRVIPHVVGAWVCLFLLSKAFGPLDRMTTPARGDVAFIFDQLVVSLAVLAMALLVFKLGDDAWLCEKLARNLGSGHTQWPTKILHEYAVRYHLRHEQIATYLDVKFLAQRTAAVMPLIYCPCIIVFLMFAARSPLFGAWHWPVLLIAVFSAVLLSTIYAYVKLRHAAEKVRSDSIAELKKTLVALPNGDDERRRLQTLIAEIRRTQNGAFAPLAKNPIVGAVMLPFAGLGAWALIQLFIG